MRLTLVPLMVRTLRISDNLAVAAEMKQIGYTKKPTQRINQKFDKFNIGVIICALAISIALIIWQIQLPELPKMGGR